MIYFDSKASTLIHPKVAESIFDLYKNQLSNPHSTHYLGQNAIGYVDIARKKISDYLGVKFNEIIFTSGATESNNIAIQGVVRNYFKYNNYAEIIVSPIEHSSVLNTIYELGSEFKDKLKINILSIGENGVVDPLEVQNLITKNTILVSVMHINNEIGTIQPIKEIGKIIKKYRQENNSKYPYFHSDGAQAVGHIKLNLNYLNVDLYSISGHKIYGPKGVGALFIKEKTLIQALNFGGGQEYSMRAGTISPELIYGMKVAFDILSEEEYRIKLEEIKSLRDYLLNKLLNHTKVKLNGEIEFIDYNTINISIEGMTSEELVIAFDLAGIAISAGSACHSGSIEMSETVYQITKSQERANSCIRISLSIYNTRQEVDKFLEVFEKITS